MSTLESELKKLESLNVHSSLNKLKECVISIYSNELKNQNEFEDSLKTIFEIDIKNNLCNLKIYIDFL